MLKSKKIKFFCFFAALIFIFALFLFSCTTKEEKDWNDIKDSEFIEDLLGFAVSYNNGKLTGDVNKKLKSMLSQEENIERLISLSDQYPARADDIKERISEIALAAALGENTYDSLEKYIDEFSDYGKNSQYINEAKAVLKNMYFEEAKESKSVELLDEFIRRYEKEDGVISGEAAGIIDEINWKTAESAGTRPAYEDYIEKNKNYNYTGKYIEAAEQKIESFDWDTAFEEYESKEIILPLKEFTDSYPNSSRIPEAQKLIKQMQDDSSYSEKYLSEHVNNLDLLDEFLLYFPGHKDTEKALELRENYIGDIYSFIEKGYMDYAAVGDSITRCRIIVKNISHSRLIVKIPFGTYLAAKSGYIQNMIILEEKTFTIKPGVSGGLNLNTACMNIYKDIPDNTCYFSINILKEDSPLIKLLEVLGENNSSYEVAQAAVWHITDNPGKDKILDTITYQDGKDAITEEDYAEALRIVDIAGR